MKYIITEDQLKKVKDKLLKIPFSAFGNDWHSLQEYLKGKGNPPYILRGNIDLNDNGEITTLGNLISVEGSVSLGDSQIKSLGNLTSVGGHLFLYGTQIKSLGNLTSVEGDLDLAETPTKSLGNLTSVGGYLNLRYTPIESLGNLTSVGGGLYLTNTPMSEKYSEQEIRDMVEVGGVIYL